MKEELLHLHFFGLSWLTLLILFQFSCLCWCFPGSFQKNSDNDLLCWGYNSDYELGSTTGSPQVYPILASDATSAIDGKRILDVKVAYHTTLIWADDGIYGFGKTSFNDGLYIIENSEVGKIVVPQKIVDGSGETILGWSVSVEDIFYRTSSGIYGWGNNYYCMLGGTLRSGSYIPSIMISDNTEIFEGGGVQFFYQSNNGIFYRRGGNAQQYCTFDQMDTQFLNRSSPIKFFRWNMGTPRYFVLENNQVFGFGQVEKRLGSDGYSNGTFNPTFVYIDFYRPESDLPSWMDLSDIQCGFYSHHGCIVLATNSTHSEVYTYGVEDEVELGRTINGNDWKYPKRLDLGEMLPDDAVIQVTPGFMLLTRYGRVYTFGRLTNSDPSHIDYQYLQGGGQFVDIRYPTLLNIDYSLVQNVTYLTLPLGFRGDGSHYCVTVNLYRFCFGVLHNHSDVCRGRGNCTGRDQCDCDYGYSGGDCDIFYCNGIMANDTKDVCSGKGECVSPGLCYCPDPEYGGQWCHQWGCFNRSWSDVDAVCAGHGVCYARDVCICQSGYSSSYDYEDHGPCDYWYCGEKPSFEIGSVCGGRGVCISPQTCKCRDDYEGETCESFSCGVDFRSDMACSSHGKCISPQNCVCSWGYSGKLCQNNMMYVTIMLPVLSISGVLFLCLLIGGVTLFCCLFCSVGFLGVAICIIFSTALSLIVYRQRRGIKRFSKLMNFDLLLKEQELDMDVSIAHIRIDKKLFEIPFDEINTEQVLGEGGSNSVVFKAKWRNQLCAFKCFKTRLLMQSQDSYDEFEREVEILASIRHKHIIQFYGATMKPPRIGIVMELCEHGDLVEFIMSFKQKYGFQYPIREKIRMLHEVIMACEFLHSRNIIHRDLKLENVLVDSNFTCKLMDFGLSRIVDRMSKQKTRKIGTSYYMAPEIVLGDGKYDAKCDSFSFAILVWILITENLEPYGEGIETGINIEMKVANDPSFRPDVKQLRKDLTPEFSWVSDAVVKCWSHEGSERWSFDALLQHFANHETYFSESGRRYSFKPTEKVSNNKEVLSKEEEKEEKSGSYGREKMLEIENRKLKLEVDQLKKKIVELELGWV